MSSETLPALHSASQRSVDQWQFASDVEAQVLVSFADGVFHLGWRVAASEDEAEVAGSLRQWHQRMIDFRRDLHSRDERHLFCLFDAVDAFEETGAGNGDHHHTSGALLALDGGNLFTDGVAQDQFLQADAGAKFQDGRAQSANGAPGDFQHPRSLPVNAQFGIPVLLAALSRQRRAKRSKRYPVAPSQAGVKV